MIGQKIRLYPTKEQQLMLDKMFKFAAHAYNKMLEYWKKCYNDYKSGIVKSSPSAYLVRDWYKNNKELEFANMTNMIIETESEHLGNAFKKFFNKKAKYPKFKNEKSLCVKNSFSLNAKNKSICSTCNKIVKVNKFLRIKMAEEFKYKNPKTFTISKHLNEYYISICFDDSESVLNCKTNKVCGIDLGLKTNITLCDENSNIYTYDQNKNKIKRFQNSISYYDKRLSRKNKNSKSFTKMIEKKYRKMINNQNRNNDFYNKVALDIVKKYDIIGIENLNIAGLKKNKHMSKSWNSATIGKFEKKLLNKANMYDKNVIKVDRTFPSSQLCSCCGKRKKMPLNKRVYVCECGMNMDRDANAAKNIMVEAQKIYKSQKNIMRG